MPNAHALLSPSAAHRWIHCTPSVRLEEGVRDEGSDFAAEGTLAHAIASRKILETLSRPHDEQDREIEELRERYYSEEMEGYTDTYRSIVLEKFNEAKTRSKDARLLVEVRLDFGAFLPDAFGTADAVIIADDLMEVIDFKYGKGVKVDADHNPQMMIYALGALDEFLLDYDIKRVRMTIVQPRIDNLSECGMMVGELTAWRTVTLKPAAEKAFAGSGEQVPGEWCQFCKVRATCSAIAEKARQICNEDFREARLISDEDILCLPRAAARPGRRDHQGLQARGGEEQPPDHRPRRPARGPSRQGLPAGRPPEEARAQGHRRAGEARREEGLRRDRQALARQAAGQAHPRRGVRQAPRLETKGERLRGLRQPVTQT